MAKTWTPVSQCCKSPKFDITGIYGSIVLCQCNLCFNTFILPGDWIHIRESDCVTVRKRGKIKK